MKARVQEETTTLTANSDREITAGRTMARLELAIEKIVEKDLTMAERQSIAEACESVCRDCKRKS